MTCSVSLREVALGLVPTLADEGRFDVAEALIRGELSVVEQIVHDGRRYFLARRGVPRFSCRQRRILVERARGKSVKVIAIELGVSAATVSRDAHRALTLLGLECWADVVRLLGVEAAACPTASAPGRRTATVTQGLSPPPLGG